MNRNCLTCANKTRLPNQPNENGGDFYMCTAEIVVPPFGFHWNLKNIVQRQVNVAMFQPGHPCYENQIAKDCQLHTLLQSNTLEDTTNG